ncbi:MAG: hypothetical protein A2V72_02120 [Candidatus Nealsonbacteria bacterium RBG_13_37_56]|uniref:PsbP C-terminal domain-containing protein n=1 Tax=Candidatus Nealsonbacteria bacterium RBG_13_37_56 TaxID=1801661 RepID=A0A1G2DXV2_9BACT|nr:MAG: hypothetical protein A2V72_02120 [Candidatus Nealsonbacteria bacterium RBG_13_37_56]
MINLNKGVSAPIALTIIIVLAVIIGGGIIAYQYYWLPKEEVKKSEIETPKDETSDWKTYSNEEYGFEFKYPETWNVSEEYANMVEIININKPLEKIIILKSSGPPPETMDMQIIESKTVIVDNITTTRELMRGRFEDNKDNYYLRVFIPEKNIFYHADFNKDNFEEFSLIYNKILSTFKFID